ncbi:CubicO group peptidase (beta-lactamase class C family) [Naumannella cuiyingiana]|uniref:CubicO group peptidase (Beta-lactamase class C family) n=1 Tax=Naumannella cuiyingiana TaxID=1347891 RepID=A0A7Z0D9P4_9ACTN|nr:serine hydrolase domain-containing protein [Naumannella cuiyingiana]NYI71560.1 CubicO group peptidase (beta-lactamase class C family) [Naumannella cuiyingiana]
MSRRLGVLAALAMVLIMVPSSPASAADGAARGRFDRPQDGFARPTTSLGESTPQRMRLDPAPIAEAWRQVQSYAEAQPDGRPRYPGGVLTYGYQGKIVFSEAFGEAVRYGPGQTVLPADQRIATRTDTIYDLASISKLFTSIVVLQQVERGRVDLDAAVADYLPEFAANGPDDPDGKASITVRQLLTHTSGLPPFLPLWRDQPDPDSRLRAALTAKLSNPPGSTYTYSDLNLIALGELVHRVSGKTLDRLVADDITGPLRMTDTGYNPDPSLRPRIAATEEQRAPDRGVVWGEVHDENAWSLGGVAGHAGVFSTSADLARLAQAMLNGGVLDGRRIMQPETVEAMITNENTGFPGDDHGLGFELNQHWYMDGLSGPRTAGHTGYTGTSLVIDFDSRSFVILLTNRVHPSREWGSVNPARTAAARGLADALAVRAVAGKRAWVSTRPNNAETSLRLAVPAGSTELRWQSLVDLEPTDPLIMETSRDGSTWQPLAYRLGDDEVDGELTASTGRTWRAGRASLPAGTTAVRWRQTFDASAAGRGVFVDDVRIGAGASARPIDESDPAWSADGWQITDR